MSQYTRRIVVSDVLFELTPELVAALREVRDARGGDDITESHDAFMLDPGLGPATYLSSDGRIIWDDDMWGVVGTRGEALSAIPAGARKTGLAGLRDLLPSRPATGTDCPDCSATGWFDAHGELRDVHGRPFSFVCPKCAGLGWTSPTVVLTDSVLDQNR